MTGTSGLVLALEEAVEVNSLDALEVWILDELKL
jgi:hypothetical protein